VLETIGKMNVFVFSEVAQFPFYVQMFRVGFSPAIGLRVLCKVTSSSLSDDASLELVLYVNSVLAMLVRCLYWFGFALLQ